MFPQLLALFLTGGQPQTAPVPASPAAVVQATRPAAPAFAGAADPADAIDKAIKSAGTDDIRVLIVWGAAGDARSASALKVRAAALAEKVSFSNEYRMVLVDVGNAGRNRDLAAKYGVALDVAALPALTVLDAAGKTVANAGGLDFVSVTDRNVLDTTSVVAFLLKNRAMPTDPNAEFGAALKQAQAQDKLVFLWFSAPWCGWCHRLGAWMAQPEVQAILAKEFVPLKLDHDRQVGALDLELRYSKTDLGLPWFAFVDGTGKAVINSTAPTGNVGHPYQPEEVVWFRKMLETVKHHLTAADIDYLIKSIQDANKVN